MLAVNFISKLQFFGFAVEVEIYLEPWQSRNLLEFPFRKLSIK